MSSRGSQKVFINVSYMDVDPNPNIQARGCHVLNMPYRVVSPGLVSLIIFFVCHMKVT
jgi:hypothetical protein